jgi:hypothetical protein
MVAGDSPQSASITVALLFPYHRLVGRGAGEPWKEGHRRIDVRFRWPTHWRGPRSSVLRLALFLATFFTFVAFPMPPALACVCVAGDPRDGLAESDAAFVGKLIRTDTPTRPDISSGEETTWTFRVDVAVKGDLGGEVVVRGYSPGGSCGFQVPASGRLGVLLHNEAGHWRGGLCSQMGVDELLAAAGALPKPNGVGPVPFLVGGSFGETRLLALDALGRTLAYGAGRGDTLALGVCPGSRYAVEAVHDEGEGFLAVRDLHTFEVVRELTVARGTSPSASAVACLDEGGDRALAIDGWGEGRSRIWLADGDQAELTFEGDVREARLHGDLAVVALPGGELIAVHADARRVQLGHLPNGLSNIALSPDRSMVAGIVIGAGVSGEPPTEVVLVQLPDGQVLRSPLEGWNDIGDVAWLDDQRLAYLPGGGDDDRARVYDTSMREIGGFDGWNTSEVTVVGETAYGMGWGQLLAADLPQGPLRVLRELDSPETAAFAYVFDGPEVRQPNGVEQGVFSARTAFWLLAAGGVVLAAALLRRRIGRHR